MAQLTKQALIVENNQSFPNNNAGAITPTILREFNTDMIDSTVNQTVYTADSASFNNKINALQNDTGSYLITGSVSGSTLTFTKDDGSTFSLGVTASAASVAWNDVTGKPSGLVSGSSQVVSILDPLNAFSASQITKDSTLATYTGSVDTKFTTIGSQSGSWDNTNLNAFSASQITKDSTLATYTGSVDTKFATLGSQSGSWVTETESGSFLITASFDNGTRNLTFTKGNATTFNVNIPDVSGSAGNFVTTSSFNSFTQSVDTKFSTIGTQSGSWDNTALNTFSASQDTKNSTLATYTASVDQKFSNIGSQSGSWDNTNLNTFTQSVDTKFNAVGVSTASLNSYTSSQDTKNSTLATYTGSNDTKWSNLGSQSGSFVTESETGSFARTDVANTFSATQTINADLFVSGTINAYKINTTIESSSVIFSSGSNILGDSTSDRQTLNGTVIISGSQQVTGSVSVDGAVTASSLRVENNTLLDGTLTVTNDTTINGDVTIQSATPNLKLRDTSGGGFSSGYDLRVDTGSFEIYDDTHNRDVLSDFFNVGTQKHTTSLTSEIIVISGSDSVTIQGNLTASLQQGYAWVGNGSGVNTQVPTSSFAENTNLGPLNAFTASQETKNSTLATYTASVDTKFSTIGTQSGSWDNTALNSFTQSQETKNSTLATYTGSNDTKWNTLGGQTGSYVTSAITGSSLVTASFSGNTLTFTKGNGTTFGVVIPDVSGSTINTGSLMVTGSVVGNVLTFTKGDASQFSLTVATGSGGGGGDLTSLNAFTASQEVLNATFATTGSNIFTGGQTFQQSINVQNGIQIKGQNSFNTGFILETINVENVSGSLIYNKVGPASNVDLQNLSLLVSGTFTSSLQQGYVWVGDSTGKTTTVPTSSFGGGGSINTGSFAITGSNTFVGDQTINGGNHLLIQRSATGANNLLRLGATDNENNFAFIVTGSDTTPGQQVWGINVAGGTWGNSFDAGVVFNSYVTASAGLRVQGNEIINGEVKAVGSTPFFTSAGNTANSGAQFPTFDAIITNNNNEFGGFNIYKQGNYPNSTYTGLIATAYSPQYGGTTIPMIIANGNNPGGNDSAIIWKSDGTAEHWKKSDFKYGIDVTGSINSSGSITFNGTSQFNNTASLFNSIKINNSIANQVNFLQIDVASGSIVLQSPNSTGGISGLAHLSSSAVSSQVNLMFKNSTTTADTIISGSNNIFVNPASPTSGFKRQIGTSNYYNHPNSVPQISGSMAWSPSFNGNVISTTTANGFTFRGPVSSSASTINHNIIMGGSINLGTSAANNHEKALAGVNITGNAQFNGTINSVANVNNLSSSVVINGNVGFGGTINLNNFSSSINYSSNINNGTFTLNNRFTPIAGTNQAALNARTAVNTIYGTGHVVNIDGTNVSTTIGKGFSYNILAGTFLTASVPDGDASAVNATAIIGNGLIVTGSTLPSSFAAGDTANSGQGSTFVGRFNDVNGTKDMTAETVFAVGTGTGYGSRKTGFLIDSGSNTFVEGSLNVSGSTSLTGSFRALLPTASNESTIDLFRLPTFVGANGTTYTQAGFGLLDYASSGIDQTFGIEYGNASFEKYSALYVGPSRTQFIVGTGTGYDYDVIELLDNDNNTTTAKVKADTVILQGAIQATGSVSISSVMNLKPQNPLPSGTIGDLAVSGSNLYFYNGAWTQIS